MPLIPGVVETYERLKTLHRSKNDDYAGEKGPFFNFEFAEAIGDVFKGARDRVYAIMIGIKLARLAVVLYKTANHESVEDTFDDLINYSCIWKADYMSRIKPSVRQIVERETVRETPVNEHP
jgi:hypothetical protein